MPDLDDRERLLEMRRHAAALKLGVDPLVTGLVAQLYGTIDALLNIADTPHSIAAEVPARVAR